MKFSHVDVLSIPVANQDAAKTFYVEVMGFELLADQRISEQMRWLHVKPGSDARTTIALVDWFEKMPPGSCQGLILETPDIEEARAEMIRRGVAVGEIETMPWGSFASFEDIDGNGWSLRQGEVMTG